jgi:prepilin-type N-terminal cleavage/methylation domain-containing protein
MRNSGITLVELLVVIAVAGILAVALGASFVGWQGGFRVESEIKDLYSDLMDARLNALQRNRIYFFDFTDSETYTIYEDDADGSKKVPDGDGILQDGGGANDDRELPSFPKTMDYEVEIGTVAGVPPITFQFNNRGLVSPERTICMFTDFDSDKVSDIDPDYDCIVLAATRIKMGKLQKQDTDGGVCRSVAGGGHCEIK